MRIHDSVLVDRPPAAVWPYLEDPELSGLWMRGEAEHDDHRTPSGRVQGDDGHGRGGIGSTFRMSIHTGPGEAEYEGEVVAFEPGEHLGLALTGGHFPAGGRLIMDYRLGEEGDGSTRVELEARFRGGGLLVRALMPVILPIARRQARVMLENLRRVVESREGEPA